ncbi:MAG: nucleotidyltransferase domain-containing protein [Desulfobacterales bacterium]
MNLTEWSDNQRRIFIDTAQLYDAHQSAFRESRSYRGGMHWKKSKGREYLFRSKDRYGYGKSLGPRSAETERILNDFRNAKGQVMSRLASLRARLKEQARFCKAASIQRAPRVVTGILRVLDQHQLLGKKIIVVGTNAVYAYEAAAGVFVANSILATVDMDLLWDIRSPLHLTAGKDSPSEAGMLGLLRKADRSFKRIGSQRFRAANKDGYMVDLLKPEPRPVIKKERRRMGGEGDLEAAELRNLQWLASSPKFRQIVIGDDGYPAAMACPDPSAFALHKLWMSEQPDRNPIKKQRDRNQAIAVAYLVLKYLPQHKFAPSELRMFPKDVVDAAADDLSRSDLPAGFSEDR